MKLVLLRRSLSYTFLCFFCFLFPRTSTFSPSSFQVHPLFVSVRILGSFQSFLLLYALSSSILSDIHSPLSALAVTPPPFILLFSSSFWLSHLHSFPIFTFSIHPYLLLFFFIFMICGVCLPSVFLPCLFYS